MLGIRAILRLSKTTIVSLFENHARYIEPNWRLSGGGSFQIEWQRRHLIAYGCEKGDDIKIAFEGREGIALGIAPETRLTRPDRRSGIEIDFNGTIINIPAPGRYKIAKAILLSMPIVIQKILFSTKDILQFIRTKDPATASRLRDEFGFTFSNDMPCTIPEHFFSSTPRNLPLCKATIVVPIYNAAEDLRMLLECLHHTSYPIIFVNDGSDDPSIRSLLSNFLGKNFNATVIENDENMGFVASANIGIENSRGHVIILNSDALPPNENWMPRLLKPIFDNPRVATVTPFSSNAEILSIPNANTHSNLDSRTVDYLDSQARRISEAWDKIKVPTGVGFCMAMNRRFIEELGAFDVSFGQGYGEEVDWCQKASRFGGLNIALASLFVGHKGGRSFGHQKAKRVHAASQIISRRYPDYDGNVQTWVKDAPAQAHKLALSIAWLAAVDLEPALVFIGHSMGGGAEDALQQEIQEALRTRSGLLILRVGGPSLWRIEFKGDGFSHVGDASSIETVAAFLSPLKQFNLIYSCGVGGRHPLDAADLILSLFDDRCTLDVRIHDFFPVSPSWNLLDSHGRFEGIPDTSAPDKAHAVPALNNRPTISHASWRATWSQIIDKARHITAFSRSSAILISDAYPSASKKIIVRPHMPPDLPRPMQKGGAAIGILGSLNKAKGAEVIKRLSSYELNSRRLVVLGEMDSEFALMHPHVFHGRYDHDRISELAEKYDIGLWFIPSICPETFSFATHEALATGLPVLAFARGAQGEAVAAAPNGYIVDHMPEDIGAIADFIEDVFKSRPKVISKAS